MFDDDELPYKIGHDHGRKLLRRGLHPEAIRFGWFLVEEFMGDSWEPESWRGLEDALAGRPFAPL
jgi:hypothetical protein